MNFPMKASWLLDEVKDYFFISLGCAFYCVGFCLFMLPYEFTPGGMTGVSAIIYYATGFPAQYSYFIINAVLLAIGLKILGFKFFTKTIYATLNITFFLGIIQDLIRQSDGTLPQVVGDQPFMAAVLGACIEGAALALVFINNGSTGGTDIIAAIVNKYRNFSMGRVLMWLDFIIVSCSFFVFHDWNKVVTGYVILLISMILLDYTMTSATQSVQFTIISDKHEEIARRIGEEVQRGVTELHGQGWYSKQERRVLIVMARRRESQQIFRLIKRIDNKAFVTMTKVVGVYGEGFDHIKT
ncbi:MAG: YitT family protein [Bacteroidaceae bacterium]|nr:YitT family protein [Bacteroidaceae bacterium]MBQ8937150.1 YitT family protein [Bacteroidaceae bacterium]MBQ9190085.1 YitT family protein [Bacteroidaceae bacterium]MBR0243929.1 YitT family protein [Bacteroidaceae bacterium]MBR1665283.1 YitT family protein [Bacteroidaceae bacterium]